MTNLWPDSSRKKREKNKINKIRSEKRKVTTDNAEIQRIIRDYYEQLRISLVAQMVKHLPTMGETQVQSLGWGDPLEKEMATHSSTLAWKIPWMEKRGRPMGL